MTHNTSPGKAPKRPVRKDPTIDPQTDQDLDAELDRLGSARTPAPQVPPNLLANLLEDLPSSAVLEDEVLGHRTLTSEQTSRSSTWRLALAAAAFIALIAAGYSVLRFDQSRSTTDLASTTLEAPKSRAQIRARESRADKSQARSTAETGPRDVETKTPKEDDTAESFLRTAELLRKTEQESLSAMGARANLPSREAQRERVAARQKKISSSTAPPSASPAKEPVPILREDRSSGSVGHPTDAWVALRVSLQQGQWPDVQQVQNARNSVTALFGPGQIEERSSSNLEALALEAVALDVLDLLQNQDQRALPRPPASSDRENAASVANAAGTAKVAPALERPAAAPAISVRWKALLPALEPQRSLLTNSTDRLTGKARRQEATVTVPAGDVVGSSTASAEDLLRAVIESALALLGSG